jgi:hypothetical protein
MTMTTMTTPLRRPEEVSPVGASLDGPARPAPDGAGHGRRRFNAGYKLAILEEYESLSDPGAKGALLRREGLYSSHIVEWRRAQQVGALAGLGPKARRPKASALEKEVERLKKANTRLSGQLERHRQALEIQGKASELLAKLLAESSEQAEQPRQRP